MEKIKLRVSGNQIEVTEHPAAITAGTVGLTAEFTFDSQWDTLSKTAVFKAGDKVVATALAGDDHTVPWEVLTQPNLWLHIGVYGANADGTAVIPTLWAKVSVIHTGADPEGDPALEPTAPVWQEVLARVEGVTAEGVGAATREEMDTVQGHLLSLQDAVDSHKENAGNPHGVTCDQIGAAPESYVMAAEEGINGRIDDHLADTTNPHGVTCEQIGAVTQEHHGGDIQMVMDEIALQVENLEYLISDRVGDIETALDSIIAIQNDLIGGDDV